MSDYVTIPAPDVSGVCMVEAILATDEAVPATELGVIVKLEWLAARSKGPYEVADLCDWLGVTDGTLDPILRRTNRVRVRSGKGPIAAIEYGEDQRAGVTLS